MPIYEYRRPDGSTFEVIQSFSEEPLTHDPETGVEVKRVLHAPAVHFKGSGFYNTDYGTRRRQRESGESGDGAPSESSTKESASAKEPASTAKDTPASTNGQKSSEPAKTPDKAKSGAAKSSSAKSSS